MKISKITFNNFRCFYGKQSLELAGAEDSDKKITLIHAENGVGKTTILNAFFWCFFGKTTETFEQKQSLINNDAARNGELSTSVSVEFTHEGDTYRAIREFSSKTNKDRFALLKTGKNGNEYPLENATSFIKTIMPEEMAGYFLFDGEHVEKFARGGSTYIKDAIRNILGCTIVEFGIEDLKDLQGTYNKELKSLTPDDTASDIAKRLEHLQEKADDLTAELERELREKEAKEDQAKEIDNHLRDTAESAQYQKQRENLENNKGYLVLQEKRARAKKMRWLGENLIHMVSQKLYTTSLDFLDEQIKKGRVPEPYNKEFVQSILDSKTCICGRPLDTEDVIQKIKDMIDAGSDALMRDKIAKARSRSALLKEAHSKTLPELLELEKNCNDILINIEDCEHQLKEISNKIKNEINLDSINQYEKKREELLRAINQSYKKIGNIEEKKKENEIKIKAAESYQREISQKNPILTALQSKIDFTRDLKQYLEQELKAEEAAALTSLQRFVADTANSIMRKHVIVRIDEKYRIHMFDENNTPLAKSGGENQMLGLAFTIALIQFAKERQNTRHTFLLSGTEAPLILDSPFGQLDPAYRQGTASFLSRADGQIALLLSRSQASREVLQQVQNNIGKEYILVRHNTNNGKGKLVDKVQDSCGNLHIATQYDSMFNGAQILEV